jgi:tRNA pseudouridine32 synthase/23S rRNA pseudouridine746 synthase
MRTFRIVPKGQFLEKSKLGEVLHRFTLIEFDRLADAAAKGAVWLQKKGQGKILRVRSLHLEVFPDDIITLYYDRKILSLPTLGHAECFFENNHYGVWLKDVGVVAQGTQSGDHTSLLRYVEKLRKKDVYLVHRLDRETGGLMIVAYDSRSAGLLSDLFTKNKVRKVYQAIVLGTMEVGEAGTIDASLDDKEALTRYRVLASSAERSLLEIEIETGRLHQIRRHLDHIGHPVIGDPKYGVGNKNREGLRLLATGLSFIDPWDKSLKTFTLPKSLTL